MRRELVEAVLAFAVASVGAGLTLRYSRRAGLLDVPNARSSHSVPTPRGGGIGIVAAVLLVLPYAFASFANSRTLYWILLLFVALAVAGWLDDRKSLSVGLRLPVHLGCGLAVAALVDEIAPLPGLLNVPWLLWWIFWTVGSINVVNFMDGIDGLVASTGVIYGLYLYAILPSTLPGAQFGLILAAACSGFLIWNWSPARIFLGDVGSVTLGFLFVIGGVLALGSVNPALVFLPLFPMFFDALVTLIRRFRRGEKLAAAHRSHLYQRLANDGHGHARVTLMYSLAAALGAFVAAAVRNAPPGQVTLAIAVYTLAVAGTWTFIDVWVTRRDRTDSR